MDILRQAHEAGLIHKGFIALENIETAKQKTMEQAMDGLQTWVNSRMPADVHAYISWFAEFHQEELEQQPVKKAAKPKKKEGGPKNRAAKKTGKKSGK